MKAATIVGRKNFRRSHARDGRKMHPNIYNNTIDSWKILKNTYKLSSKYGPKAVARQALFGFTTNLPD